MQLRVQIGITAALAAVLAAGWIWLAGGNGGTQPVGAQGPRATSALVLVEALETAVDRVDVQAIGTGEALKSASIYPTVAGEVVEVLFEAGQWVEKGAPLIRLDDKHEQLAVRLAQVAEDEERRTVKRLEKLAPKGNVSVAGLQTAQAELASASLRLAQAKAELEDRSVYAPFNGVIGMTQIEKGDRVTEGTLIGNLDDRSSILVEFVLPEEYADRIAIGDPINVRPWAMPDRELQGTIAAMDSRIDPTTRSLKVKARIENRDDTLRPGMSFEVRLSFTNRPFPRIREVAVLWSRDGAYLWRVVDGRAEKVFVKVVRRDGGQVLVDGPLAVGDLIVVEGVQGLRGGQAVQTAAFDRVRSGQSAPANGTTGQ